MKKNEILLIEINPYIKVVTEPMPENHPSGWHLWVKLLICGRAVNKYGFMRTPDNCSQEKDIVFSIAEALLVDFTKSFPTYISDVTQYLESR